MFRSRLAAATLAVPLLLLGSASAASATPEPHTTGWTCDGDVCLRYVPQDTATPLDNDGCSEETCISVFGAAGGYSAVGHADDDWFGHVDLWGPGMPFGNSGDHFRPTTNASGRGVGAACAQGWASLGGGRYESKGLPCVNVR